MPRLSPSSEIVPFSPSFFHTLLQKNIELQTYSRCFSFQISALYIYREEYRCHRFASSRHSTYRCTEYRWDWRPSSSSSLLFQRYFSPETRAAAIARAPANTPGSRETSPVRRIIQALSEHARSRESTAYFLPLRRQKFLSSYLLRWACFHTPPNAHTYGFILHRFTKSTTGIQRDLPAFSLEQRGFNSWDAFVNV